MIILHQILDGANDRQTGVATTVVRIGVNCARWFVRRMFAAELAVLITLVILLTRGQLAGLSLLLLGLPLLHVLGRRRHSLPVSLETYEHIPLADVYEMVLPLTAAARVIARHGTGHWWLALAVTLPFGRRHWQRLREIVSLWGGGSRE
jgi:4-hydroxybenzoate polyprenyltransferase